MLPKKLTFILLTLLVGLAVTGSGAILTWLHLAQTGVRKAELAAKKVVTVTESLLYEASNATFAARPLLSESCTSEVKRDLNRLVMSIEHIRMINLFHQGRLLCSSYDSVDPASETIQDENQHLLMLRTENYILPDEPVMVLRTKYRDWDITANISTRKVQKTLNPTESKIKLSLRTGSKSLSQDNKVKDISEHAGMHAIHSKEYPFSVEYLSGQYITPAIYFKEGASFLLFSLLLGGIAMVMIWQLKVRRNPLYDEMHRAFCNGEIVPWYQPIINAATGGIAGVEVLARWVKPDGKIIPPTEFISEAERSGLIISITRNLMEQVSRELSVLSGCMQNDWHISFNVTQDHIMEAGFVAECMVFCNEFPPGTIKLTIEMTEREKLDSSEIMKQRLLRLKENHIKIALDDFGTGYANIEYLSEIPVNIIKIDRFLVKKIGQEPSKEPLLVSLIEMARAMKMELVAEGVENEEQVSWLRKHGVDMLQGYFYSPPVPYCELKSLLARQ